MTHPALSTIHQGSTASVLVAGSRLTNVRLPVGARVLQSRARACSNVSVPELVARALANPEDGVPLAQRLRSGMKVLVALSPNLGSFPNRPALTAQAEALEVLLELCSSKGVSDVDVVVATGLGSRLTPDQLRRLVGKRNYDRLGVGRVRCHDSEPSGGLHHLDKTEKGEETEVAPAVSHADLVVSLAVLHCLRDGGPSQITQGLGGAGDAVASLATFECGSDGGRGRYEGSCPSVWRQFARVQQLVPVFSVELITAPDRFTGKLSLLNKREDELTAGEQLKLRALTTMLNRLPDAARRSVFERSAQPSEVRAAFAGSARAVHERAVARFRAERKVPVSGVADALVLAIPYFAKPESRLNPLTVAATAWASVFESSAARPLVREGGTLIIVHPLTDYFEPKSYATSMAFLHEQLAVSRDPLELEARRQSASSGRPAFLEMHRLGRAVHPSLPFFSWYRSEAARRYLSKVIVVGADNEYVPRLLGFETATSVGDALYRARGRKDAPQQVLCLRDPLSVVGELS